MFEAWNESSTIQNRYDHEVERRKTKEIRRKQQLFKDLGLGFVKINSEFKARKMTLEEEKQFDKSEVLLSNKSLTDELLDAI